MRDLAHERAYIERHILVLLDRDGKRWITPGEFAGARNRLFDNKASCLVHMESQFSHKDFGLNVPDYNVWRNGFLDGTTYTFPPVKVNGAEYAALKVRLEIVTPTDLPVWDRI
jgi:hypothetical protein